MVRREKIRRPSGAWPIPRITSSCGGTWLMSAPSSSTEPWRGWSRPLIVRSVVVLPAPLAPIRVTISPRRTSAVMPRSAWIAP